MNASDGYIHVVNWDKFQHGSEEAKRTYPWIRDYDSQLHKDEFLELSFHLRGILQSIRLAYSASHRQLRDNTATLTRQLGHRVTRRDIDSLVHAGFLTVSASSVLAQKRIEEKVETIEPSLPPQPPKRLPPKPREPDVIWDTLVEVVGASPGPMERGRWNKAAQSLRAAGATPATIRQAVTAYRTMPTYADCALTVTALASNWTTLTANGKTHVDIRNDTLLEQIAELDARRNGDHP